ncbi:MAG: class I SAM-dependent rRNA methyltransferase [Bacteroidaceae bacterium]|nr:class I SAM-dependent rRNA methyltransferase [Bacteroidaceae bacterium]
MCAKLYRNLFLKRGKADSLGRRHPWVFSGAVHHIEGDAREGDKLRVLDDEGRFVAVGHWQIGSIALRVLSFEDEVIDAGFYAGRLAVALDVRKKIGVVRTGANDNRENRNDMYRLVHGEGDFLPGLIIDMYGSTAVMQAHSVGMHEDRMLVAEALKRVMGDELKAIYYKSETTLPYKAELGQENGFIHGSTDNNVAVENGLEFHIDWLKGQKTGFFVDQRDNRALLESYANGRKVLNMFCYTGGFSVYAMRGGAELVHSVDSSAKAVDLVRANIELNFPGDSRHEAFAEDAFRFIEEMDGKYDLVILDPPAFAKHRDALKQALRGYTRLNARAMEKMPKGSILFTFSCSQAVNKDQFRTAIFTAAAQARRNVRILHQLHQPADHPINIYHPEGEYLKGLVLYVE